MKHLSTLILLAALALLASCCGDTPTKVVPPEEVVSRPPGIRLVQLDSRTGLAKSVAAVTDVPIFLGNFSKTRVVLFNIQNTGSVELKGLKITSNNPNFIVTPDSIPVLGVPGDTSASSLVPILQVWVGHGTIGLTNNKEPLLWDGISVGAEDTEDTIAFTWDPDTTGLTDSTAPTSAEYLMTAHAEVAAVAGLVVGGNCALELQVSDLVVDLPEGSVMTFNPGDSLPCRQGGTCTFKIPGGCLPGRGLYQEVPEIYSLTAEAF